jgi:hypothetical protein
MKKLDLIAMLIVGFMVLAYFFAHEMIRPVPFMTKAEGESLVTYREVAYKLKSKVSVDKKRFPTRADFVADLLSTNFYTVDQISFLADDECISGNELYEDDIVFWRRGDKAVFYVSKYFDCYMTSQQDFDKRLESYSKP